MDWASDRLAADDGLVADRGKGGTGVVSEAQPVAVAPADAPAGVWSPERRRLTAGLVLTITLVAFESLAIATIMPTVSDDLGGLGLYGWVFSGFFLGSLVGIVLSGQASDQRGTRLPFAVGLALFAAGLVVGGAAQSMPMLVAGRVAQGVGAGAIPAVAYAAVGQAYPADLRPRVFAIFSSAWVVPGLIGPVAAASLAEVTSWRAVFLALLPLVGLAAFMAIPALGVRHADDEPAADAVGAGASDTVGAGSGVAGSGVAPAVDPRIGAFVLVGGVALVLGGLGAGSPLVGAPLVIGGAVPAVWAFLRLVPAGTARLVPGMPAAVAVRGILTFAFFGTDAYVSLAVTDARDRSTWLAGAALTVGTLTWTTGSWVQARLVGRRGPRVLVRAGFACLLVATVGMLVVLRPEVPAALILLVWGVGGWSMGISYSSLSLTVLALAEPGHEGTASAALQLSDVLGVSLGTGLVGVFVAFGDARGWATGSSLTLGFTLTLAVAIGGLLAARRLPECLPSEPAEASE
jgi:MFS family permease